MAKYVLDFEADYEFELIGISCHDKDYKLAWNLNNKLMYNFCRIDDHEVMSKHKKETITKSFSKYEYFNRDTETEYYILSNKGKYGYLIPERNNIDYFMLIFNRFDEHLNDIITNLRSVNIILLASEISVFELKSKENLLF